jgi:predicted nucleotidyltransferase
MSPDVGLPVEATDKIRAVLASCPTVQRAVIYGSRARGESRPGSDIDIALEGSALTWEHQASLLQKLDDLLLPWKIDLCLLHTVSDVNLLVNIQRDGVLLYEATAPAR